eukprot:TRINITY_DN9259_c0_g1_i1.p1 TRINITY_DN9259_c0_g1~~TRINITY_DN9259_c0_g1_i1.p1  ORF type:complete len:271 (-),score=71.01 TRINITY_DN9259_c0_g1_i1:48-758(-)
MYTPTGGVCVGAGFLSKERRWSMTKIGVEYGNDRFVKVNKENVCLGKELKFADAKKLSEFGVLHLPASFEEFSTKYEAKKTKHKNEISMMNGQILLKDEKIGKLQTELKKRIQEEVLRRQKETLKKNEEEEELKQEKLELGVADECISQLKLRASEENQQEISLKILEQEFLKMHINQQQLQRSLSTQVTQLTEEIDRLKAENVQLGEHILSLEATVQKQVDLNASADISSINNNK